MPLKSVIESNDDCWLGTHIRFDFDEVRSDGKKTCVWSVRTRRGDATLGEVKWYSPWRKYAFFPAAGCLFEEVCLKEIAAFLEWATETHQKGL